MTWEVVTLKTDVIEGRMNPALAKGAFLKAPIKLHVCTENKIMN